MKLIKKLFALFICGSLLLASISVCADQRPYMNNQAVQELTTGMWDIQTIVSVVLGCGAFFGLLYWLFGAQTVKTLQKTLFKQDPLDQHYLHEVQSDTNNPVVKIAGNESQREYLHGGKGVIVGQLQCKGREVKLNDDVVIKQIPVADQHTECRICGNDIKFREIGGGHNSCGYHAVKNSIFALLSLIDPKGNPHRFMEENPEGLFNNVNSFKSIKRIQESLQTNLSWTSKQDIEVQLRQELNLADGMLYKYADRVDASWFTVIENIAVFNREGGSFYPVAREEIEGLPKLLSNRLQHIFIVSTAGSIQGSRVVQDGHWFAVVYNKSEKHEYIILDSKNIVRLFDPIVQKLINFIQGKDLSNDFKMVSRDIRDPIEKELHEVCNNSALNLVTDLQREQATYLENLYRSLGGEDDKYSNAIISASVT